ncbi:MAG TPA: SDR family oxidoreductase [Candidatus Polarisedimenticolia bacterium]|nr:SDR family oxidoreductase [Candidatus Polarisedimenticolia bacterium]
MSLDLVTGGAGFIGSHITERLLSEGRHVRVLDDFSSGRRENLDLAVEAAQQGRLEVIPGSITDVDLVRRAVAGADHVFHQAAIPSVPRSVGDPAASNHANVTGTLTLLIAARDAGVKRFIYASSSSVYGESPTLPKVESMHPAPLSPYAISKLAGELYAKAFHGLYGLPTIGLRYFNIFGPRQDPASEYAAVVPRFITAIARGQSPTVFGDGEQTRDFTYISNAVDANLAARDCGPAAFGGSYNVACGRRVSLLELIHLLNGALGATVKPVHAEARPGDVKHSLADIQAAREKLGYSPAVGLEEGLARTAAWFRKKI